MRKQVFMSVSWENGLSNKISTILLFHLKYMILPRLIWNSLNFLIAQYNITKIQKEEFTFPNFIM